MKRREGLTLAVVLAMILGIATINMNAAAVTLVVEDLTADDGGRQLETLDTPRVSNRADSSQLGAMLQTSDIAPASLQMNSGALGSAIWVHEDGEGNFLLGLDFGANYYADPSNTNSAMFQIEVQGSDSAPTALPSSGGSALQAGPNASFSGKLAYNSNAGALALVGGITGSNWKIVITPTDLGMVTDWYCAGGSSLDKSDDLQLTLGHSYSIALDPQTVDPTPPVPEPASIGLLALGLAGLGLRKRFSVR